MSTLSTILKCLEQPGYLFDYHLMWYNCSGSGGSYSFSTLRVCHLWEVRLQKHSDLLMKAEHCSCAAVFLSSSFLRCSAAKLANKLLSSPLQLSPRVEEHHPQTNQRPLPFDPEGPVDSSEDLATRQTC